MIEEGLAFCMLGVLIYIAQKMAIVNDVSHRILDKLENLGGEKKK